MKLVEVELSSSVGEGGSGTGGLGLGGGGAVALAVELVAAYQSWRYRTRLLVVGRATAVLRGVAWGLKSGRAGGRGAARLAPPGSPAHRYHSSLSFIFLSPPSPPPPFPHRSGTYVFLYRLSSPLLPPPGRVI